MYRTFYETATGRITYCKKMTDENAEKRIAKYPNESYINRGCLDVNKYRVNTETLQLEEIVVEEDFTAYMRHGRSVRLFECDWTQGEDSPLSAEKKAEWAIYRQQLRDLPSQFTGPIRNRSDVVWPTPPGA